jgi:zinc protease
MLKFKTLILICCFMVLPLPARADIVEHHLENGLAILVLPDSRAPVVTNQIWYDVGSRHEHSGITGISHMLEHMMFRGSEAYPPGEFSRIIARLGGNQNAFTGQDFTAYFQVLRSAHWEKAMAMEAERMHGLRLTEEQFQPERDVVVEERRLTRDDRPTSLLHEQFMASAFQNSPYGHGVIGWMTDIENYALEDVQAWYDAWYAPNNAVVVVVGDVDPDAVIEAAQRHYGPIPARPLPKIKPRTEVSQRGERRVLLRVPAELPHLIMGWKAPSIPTLLAADAAPDDAYALMVAAGVLGSGRSSRLDRELVRGQELALGAGAGYGGYSRLETLFTLSAAPSSQSDIETLEQALLDQIRRLIEIPVDEAELQRVQAQVIASEVFRQDSLNARAFELGMLETIGLGWRIGEEYAERIRAVTAADVQRVAGTYLIPDTRTVAILDPLPMPGTNDSASSNRQGPHHDPSDN